MAFEYVKVEIIHFLWISSFSGHNLSAFQLLEWKESFADAFEFPLKNILVKFGVVCINSFGSFDDFGDLVCILGAELIHFTEVLVAESMDPICFSIHRIVRSELLVIFHDRFGCAGDAGYSN